MTSLAGNDAPAPVAAAERILVIKHGALGDLVLALGAFAAIRAHHARDEVVLLTAPAFVDFMAASGLFDAVWPDPRAGLGDWRAHLALKRRFADAGFARVYDLQASDRTGLYYRFLFPRPRPEWSGTAKGCSHPDRNPERRRLHSIERQRAQLAQVGIAEVPPPSLDWVHAEVGRFDLPENYALLVPGGAKHRPAKRWPLERYVELAGALLARGLIPAVAGGGDEIGLGSAITAAVTEARDLTGQTSLSELTVIARGARLAVGNDTGPMHLAAIAGAPSVVLFGAESDPRRAAPRGPAVTVLRKSPLERLELAEILDAAKLPTAGG